MIKMDIIQKDGSTNTMESDLNVTDKKIKEFLKLTMINFPAVQSLRIIRIIGEHSREFTLDREGEINVR